ncbi:MAG TPA: S41 family peptidase [Candidatus Cybelea sp.]|nr:S41 family peptidase [Candidatus Cybelea sp.]
MRYAIAVVSLAVAFLSTGTWARAIAPTPEQRLLATMKLWGDIRLFDPQASDGSVDWDAAFMQAEPAIIGASSAGAYRAALTTLLAPLHDPATYVNDTAEPGSGRITTSSAGTVTVIRIPHNAMTDALETDLQAAVKTAAASRIVLFDIRGINESNDAGADALSSFSTSQSPVLALVKGDVTLPRDRSRGYDGFPNQRPGGYAGYSAFDQSNDSETLHGKSAQPRRFGFLVDGSTSLPPLAIALALSGDATIFTTRGQPTAVSTEGGTLELPDGVSVTYRIGDLADVASKQAFATATVGSVADAAAQLASQTSAAAAYARPPAERFVDNPYASATYPDEAMRMLAVARIYNVIRYFSPYRALMHDDWDAAALTAIADERAAGDARAYVLGLMKFYAHLHDSHGFVWSPTTSRKEFGYGPPFDARYLHRQAVVSEIYLSGAAMQGLRLGDVVDAVDGIPVRQAMDRQEVYISSSTPQSADSSALANAHVPSIFAGPHGTALTVRFHHPGTRPSLVATFTRDEFPEPKSPSPPKYFILPGNVGYVDFDRLEVTEVDAMFAALKNTRAIVFDNRGYPRGAAWPIAPRLTTRTSVRLALFNTPLVVGPIDASFAEAELLPVYQEFYQMLDKAAGSRYLKPTVMLIDERAISQSEHSALFFRETGHTRFVGTPTDGANGDVTSMVAPGGVRLNFSGEGVRHADGSQLQRVGIIPDVWVEPTAFDIAARNDVVLQAGLDEALHLSGATPQARKAAVRQELARERLAAKERGRGSRSRCPSPRTSCI